MERRLVVVAGIVALCIFAAWFFAQRALFVGQASPAGTLTFEYDGGLYIITGLDTVDMYVVVSHDSTIEIRSLDLEWVP